MRGMYGGWFGVNHSADGCVHALDVVSNTKRKTTIQKLFFDFDFNNIM